MMLLLKGGTVVSGSDHKKADVLIEGETILAVGGNLEDDLKEELRADEVRICDVSGSLLFPGFIDAHTHFDLHVAGTVTADNFYTGTRAALRGGTTMVIDFATQYHGETLAEGLKNWHEKADGKSSCDYSFHMSISDWNQEVSGELDQMMERGITSFKLYMTYDDMKVNDKTLYQILTRLKEVGGITGVHCENSGVIEGLQEEARTRGAMGVSSHPATRPIPAEAEAVDRLLRIAQIVDIPVIIVHLTCRDAYDVICRARERGQKVYAETCPQYLMMDDSLYELPGFEGARYVIAPPLRKKEDQECLWEALAADQIQTVSTDHCSFTTEQKDLGKDDFTKIPGGMPGVETRGVLMYTYGVDRGRISLEQMCRLLSENPARLYGVYPRKGCIAPGSDADIVVLKPGVSDVITAGDQIQNVDYAPFEGTVVTGRIRQVYLRGRLAVDDHQVIEENTGRFIARKKYNL